MSETNSKVEDFFSRATKWRDELNALRAILRACPVTEEFKWRSPCYTYKGGNIATIWNMKESCTLGFFKGALLKDSNGILVPPGENSRSMRVIRFTNLDQITELEAVLKDYIGEAVALEEAGAKADFPQDDLKPPVELTQKMEEDRAFKRAFEALTPGRKRGYILHFSQAKKSDTRLRRIEQNASRIREGKGLHDR